MRTIKLGILMCTFIFIITASANFANMAGARAPESRFDKTVPPVVSYPYRPAGSLARIGLYSIYYPPSLENQSFDITAKAIFTNPNPGADTVFAVVGGAAYLNGTYPDENGWWTMIKLYEGASTGPLVKDFGPVSRNTTAVTLDPTKTYRLEIIIHAPPRLVRDSNYTTQFNIFGVKGNASRGVSGGTEQTPADTFSIQIVPTLSYFVKGCVYGPEGKPVKDAKVTVKNENTGGVFEARTDSAGFYRVDIHQGGAGYSPGDQISVRAEKGEMKGENITTVSLQEYIEGEYGSFVDIYLVNPPQKGLPMTIIIGISVIGIVLIVVGVFLISSRKKKEAAKKAEEAKLRKGKTRE